MNKIKELEDVLKDNVVRFKDEVECLDTLFRQPQSVLQNMVEFQTSKKSDHENFMTELAMQKINDEVYEISMFISKNRTSKSKSKVDNVNPIKLGGNYDQGS